MGVDSNARCDKTRQNSVFFPYEKERKFARKRGGGEKEMGGGGWRERVFDLFFKGIINSLSALVITNILLILLLYCITVLINSCLYYQVKKIMNKVFHMLRAKFAQDQSYSGKDIQAAILETIKVSEILH